MGIGLGWPRCSGPALSESSEETAPAPEAKIHEPAPAAAAPPSDANPEEEAAALKQEAVSVAEKLARSYPDDALTYALLGSAYYNTGQSDEATQRLRRCLELRPDLVDAYEILARVAYDRGEPDEAARLCREALERGPATADLLNRLGRAQMDLGQAEEAAQTLERAVRLPQPTSESYYLLGQARMQSREYSLAKKSFLQAIELLPEHTQAYFGLYTACQRLGQTDEAERRRDQFLKLEAIDRQSLTDRSAREDTLTGLPMVRETVARTLFGAAQIYSSHREEESAARLFRRAAFLDPDNPMLRAAMESFYTRRGRLADGAAAFEQLAAEQPENSLNYLFLGRLQSRLQRLAAAEQSFRKVQELAPQWAEGYRALAELYLRAGVKADQARTLAAKAADLEPSGPHFYLLAVARLKANDPTGALDAVKRALVLRPDEESYRQLLESLQQPSSNP